MAMRGSTPRVFTLSLRSPNQPERGGSVRASVDDKNGLEKDPDWRHLLILVHGYNNSKSDAEKMYDRYVDILRPKLNRSRVAPDAIAKFHWPGNEAIGPFPVFDVAGYDIDIKRALQSAEPLAFFLSRLIATRPAGRQISFVGHSLGCRLILEAMCLLLDKGSFAGPPLAVVSLMAAAAPVELATVGEPLARGHAAARTVMKAYSRDDWVLLLAFPAGQSLAWAAGIEKEVYVEAIGRNGNPSGFGEPLPRAGNGHSDYWTDEFTAAMMLVSMDATLRSLPPSAAIPPHNLPLVTEFAARDLKSRKLPP